MRWQIFTFNNGYNLKNSVANGGFFQLAARLAVYTQNDTYAQWANKVWDWAESSPLLSTETWQINDNTDVDNNCTTVDQTQWTYNYGTFLSGAAYMYNYVRPQCATHHRNVANTSQTNGSAQWNTRLAGILNMTEQVFFPSDYGSNIMSEVACEPNQKCNNDQPSFKAYLSTWMAFATQMAPWTTDQILPKLKFSAQGAAAQCSGGQDGTTCGRRWYQNTWDGEKGVGEQMSAMSIFGANLIPAVAAPVTSNTGGTSKGDPNAGTQSSAGTVPGDVTIISTKDKAGAGILTALFLGLVLYGTYFMLSG